VLCQRHGQRLFWRRQDPSKLLGSPEGPVLPSLDDDVDEPRFAARWFRPRPPRTVAKRVVVGVGSPLEPLVARLAADAKPPTQPAIVSSPRTPGRVQVLPFVHGRRLLPGHRRTMPELLPMSLDNAGPRYRSRCTRVLPICVDRTPREST